MLHEQYGRLLLDAIRETLETMAFAEVIPYSMKIGEQELIDGEKLQLPIDQDGWETMAQDTRLDLSSDVSSDLSPVTDEMFANPLDSWGTSGGIPVLQEMSNMTSERIDFDQLVSEQEDWCWAKMLVNSPELHSIWFVVSKKLAIELARTMYAGEDFQLDNPVLRDIIAELTNVLGGRLMLLLEEMVGKFTLEVPETGTGQPPFPDHAQFETVMCKVLIDGSYPVIASMCFNENKTEEQKAKAMHAKHY